MQQSIPSASKLATSLAADPQYVKRLKTMRILFNRELRPAGDRNWEEEVLFAAVEDGHRFFLYEGLGARFFRMNVYWGVVNL
jgi:hypothetical protein